jgi:hypothetical protein
MNKSKTKAIHETNQFQLHYGCLVFQNKEISLLKETPFLERGIEGAKATRYITGEELTQAYIRNMDFHPVGEFSKLVRYLCNQAHLSRHITYNTTRLGPLREAKNTWIIET